MIEISPTVLILLIEALVLVIIVLIIAMVFSFRRSSKRRAAVALLVAQIKKQSEVRTQETGSFLREIYQLEDDELAKAIILIDKGEKSFFQKLINSYLGSDASIITSMDATVAELIDIYKGLKPKPVETEGMPAEERQQLMDNVERMNEQNNKLKNELDITKATMNSMLGEFGNMFGGGKDHELDSFEVAQKVKTEPADKTRQEEDSKS